LPGMMELPGWWRKRDLAEAAARPLPSQRMSFGRFLKRETATVLSWPLAWTRPVFAGLGFEVVAGFAEGDAGAIPKVVHHLEGNSAWQFKPVPTAVPPSGDFLDRRQGVADPQEAKLDLPGRSR